MGTDALGHFSIALPLAARIVFEPSAPLLDATNRGAIAPFGRELSSNASGSARRPMTSQTSHHWRGARHSVAILFRADLLNKPTRTTNTPPDCAPPLGITARHPGAAWARSTCHLAELTRRRPLQRSSVPGRSMKARIIVSWACGIADRSDPLKQTVVGRPSGRLLAMQGRP